MQVLYHGPVTEPGGQAADPMDQRPGGLPPALLASSGHLLWRLGTESRRSFSRELEGLDLRPQHFGVLSVLDAAGPCPQTKLGLCVRADASDVVAIVDGLERRGLVERRRDPVDRRRYAVTLTRAGRRMLVRARQAHARHDARFFAVLSVAERRELHDLLVRLFLELDPIAEVPPG